MSIRLLKKLTVASAAGKPSKYIDEIHAAGIIPVMRVVGTVRKVEPVPTAYGDAFKFTGEFRGTVTRPGADNLGEVSASPVAYFPEPVASLLAEQVRSVADGATVEIAIDIGIEAVTRDDEKKYQYVLKTLEDVKPSDPVGELFARHAVQLAAPTPAPEAAPAAEPEAAPAPAGKGKGK